MRILLINKDKLFHILSNIAIVLVIIFAGVVSVVTPILRVDYLADDTVIFSGNPNNKNVSLMFNIYQGSEYVTQILDVLKEKNVTVTFFVGGVWVSKNNQILTSIAANGNEVGNHGYFHKDHTTLSDTANQSEIYNTHTLVKEIINLDMDLFAPPSGAYNKKTVNIASSLGYKTIMWSKDTIDWRDQDENVLISRATKNPKSGDLILMHPTKATANVLPQIIDFYLNNGFSIVKVSDNIKM